MKKILLSLVLCSSAGFITAQSIGPATINAAGSSAIINNATHEYSIAEMAVVQTSTTNNITVTHGVLQPARQGTDNVTTTVKPIDIAKVYPVPTASAVTVELLNYNKEYYNVVITDVTGKILFENKFNSPKAIIDMTSFAAGNYNLMLNTAQQKVLYKITNNY
jgi:hypothetical protein